jgi:hypothetical protein
MLQQHMQYAAIFREEEGSSKCLLCTYAAKAKTTRAKHEVYF